MAEALAFSISDYMVWPGKTRWLMVSMLLGEECSLLLWLLPWCAHVDNCWRSGVEAASVVD